MAAKTLKRAARKVAQKKSAKPKSRAIVLVGTYRKGQLAWIEKHGTYNYPVKDGDRFEEEACRQVRELWLYADAKNTRHCFAAEFVGIQSQEEFLAANPSYAKSVGKPTHGRYVVFAARRQEYGTGLEDPIVHVRVGDFTSGRTAKVAKAVRQFREGGEFGTLADYLPTEISGIPRERLRVCEAAQITELGFAQLMKRGSCMPTTAGKIAKALDIPASEIVAE